MIWYFPGIFNVKGGKVKPVEKWEKKDQISFVSTETTTELGHKVVIWYFPGKFNVVGGKLKPVEKWK